MQRPQSPLIFDKRAGKRRWEVGSPWPNGQIPTFTDSLISAYRGPDHKQLYPQPAGPLSWTPRPQPYCPTLTPDPTLTLDNCRQYILDMWEGLQRCLLPMSWWLLCTIVGEKYWVGWGQEQFFEQVAAADTSVNTQSHMAPLTRTHRPCTP